MSERLHRGALIAPGALLGIGLGGLLDGVVLHQILQWHHMLSGVVAPGDVVALRYNMVWDGLFHAFTWVITAMGLALLWRAGQRTNVPWSTRTFVGSLALGYGLFNLVEGVIDHHLLGLHHVHPGLNQFAWDVGFLGFGAVLVISGWSLIWGGQGDTAPRASSSLPLALGEGRGEGRTRRPTAPSTALGETGVLPLPPSPSRERGAPSL